MPIFFDNCRTTPVLPEVAEYMMPFFTERFARPDGLYATAQEIYDSLTEARAFFSSSISAQPDEIIFTSGATEANNLAVLGAARANRTNGNHIIISALEHGSVIEAGKQLKREGFEVTTLDVDSEGIIDLNQLEDRITDQTILVSIISIGHFIGSMMPLKEIGAIVKSKNPKTLFHSDAAEMYVKFPLDVQQLGLDLVSSSAHKYHGPKGVGFFYRRKGVKIQPLMFGAPSFDRLRPGGENVSGIMGMRKAAEIGFKQQESALKHVTDLQEYLIQRIETEIPYTILNGPRGQRRSPYNVNISFEFIEGEAISMALSMHGVEVATGSACASESLQPNYAILAIGGDHERAHGSIRFTFSRRNTKDEVDEAVDRLAEVVVFLRKVSPLKPGIDKSQFLKEDPHHHA